MCRKGACPETETVLTCVVSAQEGNVWPYYVFQQFQKRGSLSVYKALYRKYRPAAFSDMVGEEHVRTVLKRQCETGRISHAYLFCGTRGTGKTTSAKILAKAANCLDLQNGEPCGKCAACVSIENGTATDVLELDAASNNKVDDIRAICDEIIYPPTSLKKRVYIIDEVHMLTASAYNALLKTLEEPPEHVIFVLATTELNKIPPTILSRCQRFEFRRVPAQDIAKRLLYVSGREDLKLDEEAASLIARLADGSVRDGLSLLESCIEAADGGVIDKSIVASQLGIAEDRTMIKLFKAVSERDILACLSLLDEYYASAKSLSVLLDDMLSTVRDMLYVKLGGKAENLMSDSDAADIKALSALFDNDQLAYFASVAEEARNRLVGYAMNKRLITELALIKICDARFADSLPALASRVTALENTVASGVPAKTRPAAAEIPSSAPAPRKESPKAESPKSSPARPAETPEKPFEQVSELCEQLSHRADLRKLIETSELFTQGGLLIIYCSSTFAVAILSDAGNAELIGKAARAVTGRDYTVSVTGPRPSGETDYTKQLQEEFGK